MNKRRTNYEQNYEDELEKNEDLQDEEDEMVK